MDRRVERIYIDEWVDKNGPDGLSKLALASGVSHSTLNKVRNGLVPKKSITRQLLCKTLGKKESVLFPVLQHGEQAS